MLSLLVSIIQSRYLLVTRARESTKNYTFSGKADVDFLYKYIS